jgi:hypothetical protein
MRIAFLGTHWVGRRATHEELRGLSGHTQDFCPSTTIFGMSFLWSLHQIDKETKGKNHRNLASR